MSAQELAEQQPPVEGGKRPFSLVHLMWLRVARARCGLFLQGKFPVLMAHFLGSAQIDAANDDAALEALKNEMEAAKWQVATDDEVEDFCSNKLDSLRKNIKFCARWVAVAQQSVLDVYTVKVDERSKESTYTAHITLSQRQIPIFRAKYNEGNLFVAENRAKQITKWCKVNREITP